MCLCFWDLVSILYRQRSPTRQTLSPCGSFQRLWWHCIPFPRWCSMNTFGGWGSFLANRDSGWHPTSRIAHHAQGIGLWTENRGRKRANVKWVCSIVFSQCFGLFERWIKKTSCAAVFTHLGMLEAVHPSGVFLRGDMLESHCQPMRNQDGICTWWHHLYAQRRLWIARKAKLIKQRERKMVVDLSCSQQSVANLLLLVLINE